jgi:NhaP-type Na+/H+ or K+/H+ antiporter
MMVMCPWVCYLIADGLQLSGIVAICTNGVFLNYYAQHNITADSRRVLKLCYETVAVTAD